MDINAAELKLCNVLHARKKHLSTISACPGSQTIKAKGIELQGVPTYLDMQATTPLDPRVLDRMLPYWTSNFGNPHSRTHLYGWESEDAVEEARKSVANLIGTFTPVCCLYRCVQGMGSLQTTVAQ